MQLFFNSSEEGKYINGFNYINQKVIKFDSKNLEIPNISWLPIIKKKEIKYLRVYQVKISFILFIVLWLKIINTLWQIQIIALRNSVV